MARAGGGLTISAARTGPRTRRRRSACRGRVCGSPRGAVRTWCPRARARTPDLRPDLGPRPQPRAPRPPTPPRPRLAPARAPTWCYHAERERRKEAPRSRQRYWRAGRGLGECFRVPGRRGESAQRARGAVAHFRFRRAGAGLGCRVRSLPAVWASGPRATVPDGLAAARSREDPVGRVPPHGRCPRPRSAPGSDPCAPAPARDVPAVRGPPRGPLSPVSPGPPLGAVTAVVSDGSGAHAPGTHPGGAG